MSEEYFVQDIDLRTVDDEAISDEPSEVAKELEDVAAKFYLFGCSLRIRSSEMETLEDECKFKHKIGLLGVVKLYLNRTYNAKYGNPTWRRIVRAVSDGMGGNNHALAKKIAQKHTVGSGVHNRPTEETPAAHVDVTSRPFGTQQSHTEEYPPNTTPSHPPNPTPPHYGGTPHCHGYTSSEQDPKSLLPNFPRPQPHPAPTKRYYSEPGTEPAHGGAGHRHTESGPSHPSSRSNDYRSLDAVPEGTYTEATDYNRPMHHQAGQHQQQNPGYHQGDHQGRGNPPGQPGYQGPQGFSEPQMGQHLHREFFSDTELSTFDHRNPQPHNPPQRGRSFPSDQQSHDRQLYAPSMPSLQEQSHQPSQGYPSHQQGNYPQASSYADHQASAGNYSASATQPTYSNQNSKNTQHFYGSQNTHPQGSAIPGRNTSHGSQVPGLQSHYDPDSQYDSMGFNTQPSNAGYQQQGGQYRQQHGGHHQQHQGRPQQHGGQHQQHQGKPQQHGGQYSHEQQGDLQYQQYGGQNQQQQRRPPQQPIDMRHTQSQSGYQPQQPIDVRHTQSQSGYQQPPNARPPTTNPQHGMEGQVQHLPPRQSHHFGGSAAGSDYQGRPPNNEHRTKLITGITSPHYSTQQTSQSSVAPPTGHAQPGHTHTSGHQPHGVASPESLSEGLLHVRQPMVGLGVSPRRPEEHVDTPTSIPGASSGITRRHGNDSTSRRVFPQDPHRRTPPPQGTPIHTGPTQSTPQSSSTVSSNEHSPYPSGSPQQLPSNQSVGWPPQDPSQGASPGSSSHAPDMSRAYSGQRTSNQPQGKVTSSIRTIPPSAQRGGQTQVSVNTQSREADPAYSIPSSAHTQWSDQTYGRVDQQPRETGHTQSTPSSAGHTQTTPSSAQAQLNIHPQGPANSQSRETSHFQAESQSRRSGEFQPHTQTEVYPREKVRSAELSRLTGTSHPPVDQLSFNSEQSRTPLLSPGISKSTEQLTISGVQRRSQELYRHSGPIPLSQQPHRQDPSQGVSTRDVHQGWSHDLNQSARSNESEIAQAGSYQRSYDPDTLNMTSGSEASLQDTSLQSSNPETLSTLEDPFMPAGMNPPDRNHTWSTPRKPYMQPPEIVGKGTKPSSYTANLTESKRKEYDHEFSRTKYSQEGYVESGIPSPYPILSASFHSTFDPTSSEDASTFDPTSSEDASTFDPTASEGASTFDPTASEGASTFDPTASEDALFPRGPHPSTSASNQSYQPPSAAFAAGTGDQGSLPSTASSGDMDTLTNTSSKGSSLSSYETRTSFSSRPRPTNSWETGRHPHSTISSGDSRVPRVRNVDDDATPTGDPPMPGDFHQAGQEAYFQQHYSMSHGSIESENFTRHQQLTAGGFSQQQLPSQVGGPIQHIDASGGVQHPSSYTSQPQEYRPGQRHAPHITGNPRFHPSVALGPTSVVSSQPRDGGRSVETLREVDVNMEQRDSLQGAPGAAALKDSDSSRTRGSNFSETPHKIPSSMQQTALLNIQNNTGPKQCSSQYSSMTGSIQSQRFEDLSLGTPSEVEGAGYHGECSSYQALPSNVSEESLPNVRVSDLSMSGSHSVGGSMHFEECTSGNLPAVPESVGQSMSEPGSESGQFMNASNQVRPGDRSMSGPSSVGGSMGHGECTSVLPSGVSGEFLSVGNQVRPNDQSMSSPGSVGGSVLQEQEASAEQTGKMDLDYPSLLKSLQHEDRTTVDGDILPCDKFPAYGLVGEGKFRKIGLSFGRIEPIRGDQQTSEHVDLYPMKQYQVHGLAIIINNEKFKDRKHITREGTKVDEKNLIVTFCYLGYNVEVYRDLSTKQICDLFEEVKRRDHSNHDSFICSILTHGESGKIIGSDSASLVIDTLMDQLCATNCPQLQKKPKIFFIQACRGKLKCRRVSTDNAEESESEDEPETHVEEPREMTDSPHNPGGSLLNRTISRSLSRDACRVESDSDIPDDADFFFGYATPSGRVAWRDLDHGSWYISELCRALCQYSCTLSLSDIIVKVHKEVGEKYQHDNCKQAPESTTRLTGKVFF